MMRRLLLTSITGLYLLFSVGLNVLTHTCGGSRSFEIMPISAEDPCGCSDLTCEIACCTMTLRAFQIDDAQVAAARVGTLSAADVCDVLPLEFQSAFAEPAVRLVSIASSPPPPVSPTILGCALLV